MMRKLFSQCVAPCIQQVPESRQVPSPSIPVEGVEIMVILSVAIPWFRRISIVSIRSNTVENQAVPVQRVIAEYEAVSRRKVNAVRDYFGTKLHLILARWIGDNRDSVGMSIVWFCRVHRCEFKERFSKAGEVHRLAGSAIALHLDNRKFGMSSSIRETSSDNA